MTSPSGCDCIFYSSNVGSRLQTAIADAAWQDNHCLRISALSRSDDAKVMRMTPSLPDDVVAVSVAWTPRTHWSLPSEDTLSLLVNVSINLLNHRYSMSLCGSLSIDLKSLEYSG